MDEGKIVGLVVLSIPWGMAVYNVRHHLKKGRMIAYKKRYGGDGEGGDDSDGLGWYITNPKKHPISYWLLLSFYWLVAIAVPAAALYVVLVFG